MAGLYLSAPHGRLVVLGGIHTPRSRLCRFCRSPCGRTSSPLRRGVSAQGQSQIQREKANMRFENTSVKQWIPKILETKSAVCHSTSGGRIKLTAGGEGGPARSFGLLSRVLLHSSRIIQISCSQSQFSYRYRGFAYHYVPRNIPSP